MKWDKDSNLRNITLRFFEKGMDSLSLLRNDCIDFPEDIAARRHWVAGIREFADRAQRLADEWEMRLAKDMKSEGQEAEPQAQQHDNKDTPPA